MVSQHAKTQHSVIITTLLNFIKDHAERAECQGEWVIVLLLSIRLQNFTKWLQNWYFSCSFEVLLQMLQGDMSPHYEPLIMFHPAGSQLITELLKIQDFCCNLQSLAKVVKSGQDSEHLSSTWNESEMSLKKRILCKFPLGVTPVSLGHPQPSQSAPRPGQALQIASLPSSSHCLTNFLSGGKF